MPCAHSQNKGQGEAASTARSEACVGESGPQTDHVADAYGREPSPLRGRRPRRTRCTQCPRGCGSLAPSLVHGSCVSLPTPASCPPPPFPFYSTAHPRSTHAMDSHGQLRWAARSIHARDALECSSTRRSAISRVGRELSRVCPPQNELRAAARRLHTSPADARAPTPTTARSLVSIAGAYGARWRARCVAWAKAWAKAWACMRTDRPSRHDHLHAHTPDETSRPWSSCLTTRHCRLVAAIRSGRRRRWRRRRRL